MLISYWISDVFSSDLAARKSEMVAQREQHLRPRIRRHIFCLGAERELRRRAEYMAMRSNRTGRRHEMRLRGIAMPTYNTFGHPNTIPSISLRAENGRATSRERAGQYV